MDDLLARFAALSPAKRQLLSLTLQLDGEFDLFPLSFAQERLWFLEQLVPHSPAYHVPLGIRLTGPLDLPALTRSLRAMVQRHEVLRTRFIALEGQPAQLIMAEARPSWQLLDFQSVPPAERNAALPALLTAAVRLPFNLTSAPLLRCQLFRLAPTDHMLLLTLHHIIFDGWSVGLFFDELAQLYLDFANRRPASLAPLPLQYADFAVWQREWAQTEELDQQLAYWRRQLAGDRDGPPLLELPIDYARPAFQSFRGADQRFALSGEVAAALRRLGRQEFATLFMLALAAFKLLLHRYTGQTDILVGTPVANRRQPETEELIGFFVNTLVLRTDLSGNPRFRALLGRVREVALAAYEHQDLPFERLIDALQIERTLSNSPLFQVMFSVQNVSRFSRQIKDVTFTPFQVEMGTSKFDLSVTVDEVADGLVASIQYNTDLFAAETIARMGGHFQTVLAAIAADPGRRIGDVPLLTEAERAQLLAGWHDTRSGVRGQGPGASSAMADSWCVHRLFEAQAARTPDAVACVTMNDEERTMNGADGSFIVHRSSFIVQLSYDALNRRANQVAWHLRRMGVRPEMLVGICMDRTLDLAVGLLGIMKSGGAFVPLDPEHPAERIAFMLADSGARIVVTKDEERTTNDDSPERENGRQGDKEIETLPFSRSPVLLFSGSVVDLHADWPAIAREHTENPPGGAEPTNLAYVIYTSGSTGRPKGVLIEHGPLANTMFASQAQFALSAGDTLPCIASFAFDIALFELFGPLLAGGRAIILTKQQVLDFPRFATTLEQLSFIHALPSMMGQIVDFVLAENARTSRRRYRRVQKLFVGGDLIPPALVAGMRAAFDAAEIYLGYGPTENTIMLTNWVVPPDAPMQRHLVGMPMLNMTLRLCDAHGQLVPIGVPGEIYIGGAGVARGYLNRPDLTAEKFVPNPFAEVSGIGYRVSEGSAPNTRYPIPDTRLYRTGDLARYRPDGNLEFLGRIDGQVKIRGYRIELGEIEALLRAHPSIHDGVVVVREDVPGDRRLVAYIVRGSGVGGQEAGVSDLPTGDERRTTNDESEPSSFVLRPSSFVSEVRAFLKERLPDYMVPSAFVELDALPVTSNGKVDRRALPAPSRPAARADHAGPLSALEQTIAAIWQEVLQVEQVGVHDNFFDLGGHSLLMVRVHSLLRDRLQRELAIVDLFQYPTVHALAQYLDPQPIAITAPTALSDPAPTTAAQRGSGAIAIIGMAGRFPGAPTLEAFWRNLREGVESISFFSEAELIAAGLDPALVARPDYVRAKGVLADVEWFDAAFFGFTPREAEWMDPQHRVFMECAWEALERAGYDSETYAGRIGVFAGVSPNTYLLSNLYAPELLEAAGLQTLIGSHGDSLTTRVSYKLNLKGLSVNVQTACSTSLVAVSLGCESLLSGQCDMVLAGGAAIRVPSQAGYLYEEGGIGSPDGYCRAFDAAAQGTVGGDGAGVVLLKRLDDALADGDPIQAVVKGWALNNDGAAKVGYTAPGVDGQRQVIAEALAKAGIDPETIGYVEAHGTGTPLGDPIEVAALTQAFRAYTPQAGFCALGSVKANIGHLDAAAGVAGLIKAVLALQAGELPPSPYFAAPNPRIDLAASPFYINAARAEWRTDGHPRRAAVSSFGIGGTNAHIVLEQAPEPRPSSGARDWQVLTLAARTPAALDRATANLAEYLREQPALDLADVAYTLQVGRRGFDHRRALVCRDRAEALALLAAAPPERVWSGKRERERPLVFMFPGQGAQFAGMGRELYQAESVFRDALDRCAELFRPHLGLDIRAVMFDEGRKTNDERRTTNDEGSDSSFVVRRSSGLANGLQETWLTQPALFAVEYALAQLWISWGVRPWAMIGHSLGEYVAACLADVFTLEDAVVLVAARGRLMQSLPAGAMAAVPLSEAELRPLLGPALALAAVNAPNLCVVSGPVEAVDAFHAQLAGRGLEGWRLPATRAFHSAMFDPILADFAEQVARASLRPPRIPFVSNVTGAWITPEQATDPDYWVRHLRQPVQFARGLETLRQDGDLALLEVGPGRTMSRFAQAPAGPAHADACFISLHSTPEPPSEQAFILATLARLWLAGATIDWEGFHAHERRRRVPLPTYPFERRRYWIEPRRQAAPVAPAIAGKRADLADWFYRPAWQPSLPPPAREAPADQISNWLVFAETGALSRQLLARLKRAGQLVTMVRAGDRFGQLDEHSYQLDPARPEDFTALLRSLREQQRLPRQIVHLWSLTPRRERPSGAFFERCQRLGYYSLLYLARALEQAQVTQPVRLEVVTNDVFAVTGSERVRAEKCTLLGPCKVIPQEYLNLTCRCVDVVVPGSRLQLAALIDQLLAEFQASSPDTMIAYRGRQRWAQTFEPVRLEGAAERPAGRLRPGGVYLITGGLGNVGLQLAEYLARAYRARLVLLGRSPFPARAEWDDWLARHDEADAVSRRIRRLLACEAHGGEVLVVQADVTDIAQVRAAIAQALEGFGTLHGVLHTAAASRGPATIQPVAQIGREASEALFGAKVHGTAVLWQALRGHPLDFCLLFSSNAAVLGGLGFGAYAAANLFMDAFAAQQYRLGEEGWLSVNWDGWPSDEAPPDGHADPYTMTRAEAEAALERALALPAQGQLVVATGDLPARLAVWIRREALEQRSPTERPAPAATLHPRPDIGDYIAPRDQLEQRLAGLWQELLGVDRVGVEDHFFALGGHSLLALELLSNVRAAFGIELSVGAFFAAPTVAGLAQTVAARQAAPARPAGRPGGIARRNQSIDQQLAELAALSPEQAAHLLQTESQPTTKDAR